MPDKITAIAMWLIDTTGKSSVTKDEVKAEFRNAGEAVPGTNYSRDFNAAISLKFLSPEIGGRRQVLLRDAYWPQCGRRQVRSGSP